MNKFPILLPYILFLLSACSAPQVTVTSEVTVTLTPIPTPTLDPRFIALQESISDSGERFSLHADGLIYDGETPIPGLTVAPDGTMTLEVDGETVTLDPADVDFDDEDGISIESYELDETGTGVEVNETVMVGPYELTLGQPDEIGDIPIEQFTATDPESEIQQNVIEQTNPAFVGIDPATVGWYQLATGEVVLRDLDDPTRIVASLERFKSTARTEVAWHADALDNMRTLLNVEGVRLWELNGGSLGKDWDKMSILMNEILQKEMRQITRDRGGVRTYGHPSSIVSIDRTTGIFALFVTIPELEGTEGNGILLLPNEDKSVSSINLTGFEVIGPR